jgi:ATP-dependent Clp protease ATP-binding subunit ClpA
VEQTIAILRGLRERYENFHKVKIQDAALVAAAIMSQRYLTDRKLPDKAIDLVDEAASRLRIELDSMPVEIDTLERKRRQLEIERLGLKREKDAAGKARRGLIEQEIAETEAELTRLKAHWEKERFPRSSRRARRSKRSGSRSSRRSGPAISRRSPGSDTATFQNSSSSSRPIRRPSPRYKRI